MAVFRVERNGGYTVMSNHHLRNKELTLKAKGLLSQMLSLPEDWDYRRRESSVEEALIEMYLAGGFKDLPSALARERVAARLWRGCQNFQFAARLHFLAADRGVP